MENDIISGMVNIRPAEKKDRPAIMEIIKMLDLSYPGQKFDGFRVAEKDGEVAGIANLEEFGGFYFLSAVGVAEAEQHHQIASKLLDKILAGLKKEVYLYTVIPGFFQKFGFEAVEPPAFLPVKQTFSCRECTPALCTCMVRRPDQ
jgi:N-acetylglutamate synthase-like GNAT family acetyltransferase